MSPVSGAWWESQRVCVTGGAGVIGRALLNRLVPLHPSCLRSCDRRDDSSITAAIDQRMADICDISAVRAAIDGCSLVFHLAADKRPAPESSGRHARTNVAGTACVLAACEDAGVETVVYASTAHVYAPSSASALDESAPVIPLSSYARSKFAAEDLVGHSSTRTKTRAVIARLANVYGEEAEPDTVIGHALRQASSAQLTFRDLRPVRDFIHVADVAEALVRLAPAAAIGGVIVNVGTGVGTSVRDLAAIVADWAGRHGLRPRVASEVTASDDGSDRLVLDNTRLRALTGWAPEITLLQGLQDALSRIQATSLYST